MFLKIAYEEALLARAGVDPEANNFDEAHNRVWPDEGWFPNNDIFSVLVQSRKYYFKINTTICPGEKTLSIEMVYYINYRILC